MAGAMMLTMRLYPQTQLLLYLSLTSVLVTSWTYTYSNETMIWTEAKAWCENQSQRLMVIQNEEVNNYLKDKLPKLKAYYWIGLRKIAGSWTWHGTAKMLEGNGSWARNEPNNKKQDEDCVEIYINNEETNGKWNDEKCTKKKHALCYNASCFERSCSKHAECVENISNYTCKCNPGFTGPNCKEAMLCKNLSVPDGGIVSCYKGNSTICTVECPPAYLLLGAREYTCWPDGSWSQFQPLCASYKHMLMASSGFAVFSTICCCMFCYSYLRKRKKSVKQNDQGEVMNPVYNVGDAPLEDPLTLQ
ncbi:L-selectin isoform X1 [Pangasianodon hypophthalmus]|uniref:L-selectin isoform X1 n=1 Tax=Pangasianodon hypophthalmus TaxID=310915 RepID=UPI000EFE3555|nr:L-selectin isoform X1 [Pangasianodon hypophthalmus]